MGKGNHGHVIYWDGILGKKALLGKYKKTITKILSGQAKAVNLKK